MWSSRISARHDRERLDANLALARELGAEVHCLQGADFVQTPSSISPASSASRNSSSATPRRGRSAGSARTPIDRLIDGAEGFDVRLFPHEEAQ